MNVGEYQLDEALYIWFCQQREVNIPISGALLQEKARALFERLYPDTTKKFTASTGFQQRFCKRHGLRNLATQGEQASSDFVFACDFQFQFNRMIEGYSLHQLFNCDETCSLSQLNLGSIKLPLLLIGKSARPKCFRNMNMGTLPVTYTCRSHKMIG